MALVPISGVSAVNLSVIVSPVTARVESRGLLDLIDTNVSCGIGVTVTLSISQELILKAVSYTHLTLPTKA